MSAKEYALTALTATLLSFVVSSLIPKEGGDVDDEDDSKDDDDNDDDDEDTDVPDDDGIDAE
jgi:hypothetical protein